MSFYISRKLVCDIIVLYIRVDTGVWYKFTTSDGRDCIEQEKEEPLEIMLEQIQDDFAYPIMTIHLPCKKKIIAKIMDYKCNNQLAEVNGYYIKFNDGSGFSIFEKEDCLKISDGVIISDEYSLIECN